MAYWSKGQHDLLSRVQERGYTIDQALLNYCAYYPLFGYVRFYDKETEEWIQGQRLVCKDCTKDSPNIKCKHCFTPLTNKVKTVLRKEVK